MSLPRPKIAYDDPVRAADIAAIDRRPVKGLCEICGKEVHGPMGNYGCDYHYAIPGYGLIHDDCFQEWARDFYVEEYDE